MRERISVLKVPVDVCSAKEAMKIAISYMETEAVNVIEVLNSDVALQADMNEELRSWIENMDMVLIGERMLLEATKVQKTGKFGEPEGRLFTKMFVRYLHKNRKKVFLLADGEKEADEFEQYLHSHYSNIKIRGKYWMTEEIDELTVHNRINGTENDCILSIISAPKQEEFIAKNKNVLNSRVWLGLGSGGQLAWDRGKSGRIRSFFLKSFLKQILKKEQRKNEA